MAVRNKDIVNDLQAATDAAQERIEEQEARIKELESDLDAANGEIDDLRVANADLSDENESLRAEQRGGTEAAR